MTDYNKQVQDAMRRGMTQEDFYAFLDQYQTDLRNPVVNLQMDVDAYSTKITHATNHDNKRCYQQQKAIRKLRDALDMERSGWRPEWIGVQPPKYYPYLDEGKFIFGHKYTSQYFPEWAYLPTKVGWELVLEEVGENTVKLALFDIHTED